MDLARVGERLRWEREHAGLDWHQLAERAGLPPSTVARIENGTHATVTLAELDHLAVVLGVPVRRLTSGTPAHKKPDEIITGPTVRRANLSRLIERGLRKSDERLTVNPDPLKVVAARPGDSVPDRAHVLAVKPTKAGAASRVSVHREGCPRVPSTADWTMRTAARGEISALLDKVGENVPASISCRTCGGWSSLP